MRAPRWLSGCLLLAAGGVAGGALVGLITALAPLQQAGKALRTWTAEQHAPPPLPGVVVRTLAAGDVLDTVVAWGRLVPERQAVMAFRVGGALAIRPVEVGTRVAAGDVLAALEPAVATAGVAEAEALLARAQADLARFEQLAEHATPVEREAAVAEVAMRTAMLVRARDHLAAHRLTAPFDGVIVAVGPPAGSQLGPGVPVATVAECDPIRLELPLPPHRVPTLRAGMPVAVAVDGLPEALFTGTLHRIPPDARAIDGLFVCEVRIPNPQGTLRAGYVARGAIERGRFRDVIALPRSAVAEGADGVARLALVRGDTVHLVVLADPILLDDRLLVRDAALVGQTAVIAGPRPLADGTHVRAVPEGGDGAPRLAAETR